VAVDGDVVVAIETALILGLPWPPAGVRDTAETRAARDRIAASIAALPPGVIPDVPSEWPSG
jgi:hypothetical protein